MHDGTDDAGGGRISNLTRRIRTGARRALGPAVDPSAPPTRPLPTDAASRPLPVRYQIKEDEGTRYLSCSEASNIAVRVERGLAVAASAARKASRGTIYLDGAAQTEPFMDAAKSVFNLDHHEGVVRAFTLATCEQAMVLVLKGLDLDDERWTVWVNEPDFDAVLALWLLLNHRRLADSGRSVRRRIMPVVRLQGVIDAHGLELADLSAFPSELQQRTLDTINELRAHELALKADGEWSSTDFLEYTCAALQRVDDWVYTAADFADHSEIEEIGRTRVSPHRLAIACRAEAGIYEVEEHLRGIHGDRLGLVILQKEDTAYTIRQSDPFLPSNLEPVYERLNLLDPAADGGQRWGGSGDIGGSPRGTGTRLGVDEILDVCRWVFQPPSLWRRLRAVAAAGALVGVALLAAVALSGHSLTGIEPGILVSSDGFLNAPATASVVVVGLLAMLWGRRNHRGCFGWRMPRDFGFLVLLPAAALGAAVGGIWALSPAPFIPDSVMSWWLRGPVMALVAAVGIELLIHGAAHGVMVKEFSVMAPSSSWFVSVPNSVSAVLYATALSVCLVPPPWLNEWLGGVALVAVWWGGGLGTALLCGCARERGASVWAAVMLHVLSVIGWWAVLTAL